MALTGKRIKISKQQSLNNIPTVTVFITAVISEGSGRVPENRKDRLPRTISIHVPVVGPPPLPPKKED